MKFFVIPFYPINWSWKELCRDSVKKEEGRRLSFARRRTFILVETNEGAGKRLTVERITRKNVFLVLARCQSDMIGIKADGRITSIYFSCRNFLWNPHEIPLSRSLRLFPRFLPILTSIFGGKKVDRYRYRYEINPTVSHFYSNESIGFLWRSIDRSIDYAPERVKLAEGPFNSGKWLDRNNWSHPTDRCNLFDYRWSRWPMYKSAASFPLDAISLESEIHRLAVFSIGSNRWIVRASSISSERKCCVGHDTR